ncbi:MAG: hypothetical protein AB7K09_20700 [Planctomycetota bacterium]
MMQPAEYDAIKSGLHAPRVTVWNAPLCWWLREPIDEQHDDDPLVEARTSEERTDYIRIEKTLLPVATQWRPLCAATAIEMVLARCDLQLPEGFPLDQVRDAVRMAYTHSRVSLRERQRLQDAMQYAADRRYQWWQSGVPQQRAAAHLLVAAGNAARGDSRSAIHAVLGAIEADWYLIVDAPTGLYGRALDRLESGHAHRFASRWWATCKARLAFAAVGTRRKTADGPEYPPVSANKPDDQVVGLRLPAEPDPAMTLASGRLLERARLTATTTASARAGITPAAD